MCTNQFVFRRTLHTVSHKTLLREGTPDIQPSQQLEDKKCITSCAEGQLSSNPQECGLETAHSGNSPMCPLTMQSWRKAAGSAKSDVPSITVFLHSAWPFRVGCSYTVQLNSTQLFSPMHRSPAATATQYSTRTWLAIHITNEALPFCEGAWDSRKQWSLQQREGW